MTKTKTEDNPRRHLPSVDRLLRDPRIGDLVSVYGHQQVRVQVQEELEVTRRQLASVSGSEEAKALVRAVPDKIIARVEKVLGDGLRRVINATGIFIHTNLGRAPLPRRLSREVLPPLLDGYCDLELNLDSGSRGERNRHVDRLLSLASGAESGLVVNNCAAALVLILSTLAQGKEVVVSRGELVEIGGSFRVPEIMATAGVRLVEVGTTNRTHPRDYENAIGPETALLLKVHSSNYRISGFVASVSGGQIAEIAHRNGLPVVVDEGSGLLRPHGAPQLRGHPSMAQLVSDGCDVVCGSGDKLLAGPQAGLIVGRRELLQRCRKHPLYRAFRPNRFTFAALEETLRQLLADRPRPFDRMWPEPSLHRGRLHQVSQQLGDAEIIAADGYLGGGSAPEAPIPGEALAIPADEALFLRLRQGSPSVMGYLREGRLILDLRTVDPEDDADLVRAVHGARSA